MAINIYLYAEQTLQDLPGSHHPSGQRLRSDKTTTVLIPAPSTEQVEKRLKKINTSRAVALAVVVNSPGGLPVQSQIITEKLKEFSIKKNLKLYTFARDVAASGGYMVLCGGDHVVADQTSIVGSIGVVFQKLRLKGLIEHFDVDHKHFATNKYSVPQTENFSMTSCLPTRISTLLLRDILRNFANPLNSSSLISSKRTGETKSRTTPQPFQEMCSLVKKPSSEDSLTKLAP